MQIGKHYKSELLFKGSVYQHTSAYNSDSQQNIMVCVCVSDGERVREREETESVIKLVDEVNVY